MRVLLLVILSIAVAATSLAEVSPLISYQGVLTDTNQDPLEGPYDLAFAIYNTDGDNLWGETHLGVSVEGGVFHVLLGGVVPFPGDLFDEPERWVGVTVNNNPEITPRSKIVSVPWAMHAAVADVALSGGSGGDGHSLDAADGDPEDVVFVDDDGKVGIGTTAPVGKLHVNGNIHVQDGNRYCFINQNQHWAMGKDINDIGGSNDDLQIQAYGGGGNSFQIISLHGSSPFTSECRFQVNLDSGNVGIGTTTPARTLHVNDVMRLEPRASAPSSPQKGDIYMDDTLNMLRVYDGTDWKACWE